MDKKDTHFCDESNLSRLTRKLVKHLCSRLVKEIKINLNKQSAGAWPTLRKIPIDIAFESQ